MQRLIGLELHNARVNLPPVDDADRVVSARQTRCKRLEALQADLVEALQFHNRFKMVVNPHVQLRVVFIAMNTQPRRLFTAFVATGCLTCGHGRQQALGQRLALGCDEGLHRGFKHARPGQHVARHAEVIVKLMAAPIHTRGTGVCRARAHGRQHVQLALVPPGIGSRQCSDGVCG